MIVKNGKIVLEKETKRLKGAVRASKNT